MSVLWIWLLKNIYNVYKPILSFLDFFWGGPTAPPTNGKKNENKPWIEFQIQTKKWPIGKVLFDYPVKTMANSLHFGELAPAAKSKYFK